MTALVTEYLQYQKTIKSIVPGTRWSIFHEPHTHNVRILSVNENVIRYQYIYQNGENSRTYRTNLITFKRLIFTGDIQLLS